jgi:hypothetical protein
MPMKKNPLPPSKKKPQNHPPFEKETPKPSPLRKRNPKTLPPSKKKPQNPPPFEKGGPGGISPIAALGPSGFQASAFYRKAESSKRATRCRFPPPVTPDSIRGPFQSAEGFPKVSCHSSSQACQNSSNYSLFKLMHIDFQRVTSLPILVPVLPILRLAKIVLTIRFLS